MAQYKIGVDEAVPYVFGYVPDPSTRIKQPESDAAITYNGPEVIDEQPWLFALEQGAAQFFNNVNAIFSGTAKGARALLSFVENYWQILIVAAIALIIVDKK